MSTRTAGKTTKHNAPRTSQQTAQRTAPRTAKAKTSRNSARPVPVYAPGPLPQAFVAMACGLILFIVLLAAVAVGYDIYYAGRIFPGVSVSGVDLSGLTPQEAAVLLSQRLTFPETGRIAFQEGKQVWVAKPEELGLYLDPENSALSALHWGRQGDPITRGLMQFTAWYSGHDLPPILVYDERVAQRYLTSIASQIDKPTIEASLSIQGNEVAVTPGQVGRSLVIRDILPKLRDQMQSQTDGMLQLQVEETPPVILDASAQAEIARQILSAPLVLQIQNAQPGDPGPWTFDRDKLVKMLTIERVDSPSGSRYQIGLKTDELEKLLNDLAPSLVRTAANAHFTFNDNTRQLEVLQPATIGRNLNISKTIQSINDQVALGNHTVNLEFDTTNPQVGDNATAKDLGITELVSQQTSYFYGSASARLQNIKTAASRFHGVLVAPGETFSMAQTLGDVSLDNGYAEALIIYGDRTIKGVGGGVCQVSTTLFRTVFFGGYPVVERHSHAYRVGYYEQKPNGQYDENLAGLDATVFFPVVDFRFTNDTPNWLLMETYVEGYSLTWKFYSTSDGRQVEWTSSGLQNVTPPPDPVYEENPDLSAGEIKQVDWQVAGADVSVSRTVYKDGEAYIKDEFDTHYVPWSDVFQYGPGTKVPKNKNGN